LLGVPIQISCSGAAFFTASCSSLFGRHLLQAAKRRNPMIAVEEHHKTAMLQAGAVIPTNSIAGRSTIKPECLINSSARTSRAGSIAR
jgi:hypothetical protein